MSTRTRPMAVDGHSFEADTITSTATRAKVGVVILDLLRHAPLTDDMITDLYDARADHYPGVPKVTAQRIRTARADLTHRGLVIDSGRPGKSKLGNAATVWELAS